MKIRLNCTLHYMNDGAPTVAAPGDVIDYDDDAAEELIEAELAQAFVEPVTKAESQTKKTGK